MSYKKTDKLTAQQLANAIGKNVDTVRKHAKAGKIPGYQDKNGKWTFLAADFPDLFGNQNTVPSQTLVPKLTDVIFVLDRSGSMQGLIDRARQNLQSQIDTLRLSAGANDTYRVSVINFDDTIQTTASGVDVRNLGSAASLYKDPNGWTRLYDAILEAIRLTETLDTGGKQHAFLISIVTDGQENRSKISAAALKAQIGLATSRDRYTFVFAGPAGSKYGAVNLGIPDGNATEWEQSYAGTVTLGVQTNSSLNTYARSRSVGQTYSTSFYAAPVTKDAAKFAGQLGNKLDDVSNQVKVERVGAGDPNVIAKFCQKKFGNFPKGQIYYQLTESEKVQAYKKLIVQDTTTGNFYAGEDAAKKLLGVPNFQGTVHLKPGALGEFKVFVQSTSVNRKLTPGTAVVYLP
jgi:uncharacterized protein YegL